MRVISYLTSLPQKTLAANRPDDQKIQTLAQFVKGVSACGDHGEISHDMTLKPCDAAMILGWVHEHGKTAPHLTLRQNILTYQKQNRNRVIIADSNLFLYRNTSNPHNYLRYSFDGVFPNTGEYCDSNPDPNRWNIIRRDMNVDLRDWRTSGTHILLCLQRNGGWSMAGFEVVDWALMTIKHIRQHSDRPIRLRGHPGDRKAERYIQELSKKLKQMGENNVAIGDVDSDLARDFKHCWAVVNHNSSPGVAAAIEGIPVFVTDPEHSQAREVCNTDLALIENPLLFERLPWIQRISQFHWSLQDITDGTCWRHMRQWMHK
jgi:hypothetical protein